MTTASEAKRPATAADVAALAGVSRATVSHILGGRETRFPERTRAKVREAARALDYQPSPAGRGLVNGRTDTLVLLYPKTTVSTDIQETVERLEEEMGDTRSNVVVRFASDSVEDTVTALLRLRPLAVIDLGSLGPEARARLSAQGVPTLPDIDHPVAMQGRPPNEAIASAQLDLLTERGPRRIVYAASADDRPDFYGPGRYAALQRVCLQRGIAEPVHVRVPLDPKGAAEQLAPLIPEAPLGVAAYNDGAALAVLSGSVTLGLDVPREVAVVGMDATKVGQLWQPRLTTVAFDMRGFIEAVIMQLRQALAGAPIQTLDAGGASVTVLRGETT